MKVLLPVLLVAPLDISCPTYNVFLDLPAPEGVLIPLPIAVTFLALVCPLLFSIISRPIRTVSSAFATRSAPRRVLLDLVLAILYPIDIILLSVQAFPVDPGDCAITIWLSIALPIAIELLLRLLTVCPIDTALYVLWKPVCVLEFVPEESFVSPAIAP